MDLGLDLDQLRAHIVRPILNELELWSPAAENLVIGTGITESRLYYLKQMGEGPALGIYQMEPFTHNDLWRTTLWGTYLGARVSRLLPSFSGVSPRATEMIGNLYYATAMCRVHYRRIKEPLPANDAVALAKYWKQYYNTPLGKGSWEKSAVHFALAVNTQ